MVIGLKANLRTSPPLKTVGDIRHTGLFLLDYGQYVTRSDNGTQTRRNRHITHLPRVAADKALVSGDPRPLLSLIKEKVHEGC